MEENYENSLFIEYNDIDFLISVGQYDKELNFKIIETETIPSKGIQDGKIINLEESVKSLKSGLSAIEKKTNIIFKEANVITNQKNFDCINVTGYKKMNGNQILEDDISFILNDLKKKISDIEKNKTIIHLFNTKFILDKNYIKNLPIGLFGDFYSHQLTFFLMDNNDLKNIKTLLNKSNLNLNRIILKSFSDGISLVNNNNSGSFINICIGEKDSQIIFFYNSAYSYFQNFNFGSNLIYNDIAKVCSLDLDEVKKLIKDTSFDKIEKKEKELINQKYFKNKNFRKISLEHVKEIIIARVDEITDIIFRKNINLNNLEIKNLPIYLTLKDINIFINLRQTFKNSFKEDSKLVENDNNILNKINNTQIFGELISKGWSSEAIPVAQRKNSLFQRFFSVFFD